ncbi:MAG: LysM peptidoglycan-binding domain-containing protein [Thermoflexales bacterium]|nr:LysM peptidoglycan-binding domain-containing protein [Thermoflexales bacterium]
MTQRFVHTLVLVLVAIGLIALPGCERPKSTGTQLPTPAAQTARTATPTIQPEIPPAMQTAIVAGETPTVPTATKASQPAAPTATPMPSPHPTLVVVPMPTPVPGAPSTHIVQPGEWLWSIARKYNVDPQAIAQANNLIDPGTLQPGQTLIIPASGSVPAPTAAPGGTSGQITHVVQSGENLFRVALKYNRTVQSVATANGITNKNLIYPGQVLIIP